MICRHDVQFAVFIEVYELRLRGKNSPFAAYSQRRSRRESEAALAIAEEDVYAIPFTVSDNQVRSCLRSGQPVSCLPVEFISAIGLPGAGGISEMEQVACRCSRQPNRT